MTGEGFAAVPTWMIRDETISLYAIAVYASLASRAGFESIHPGQPTIAAEARCSERKVRDAIKELRERGLIETYERTNTTGRATTAYVLRSGRPPESREVPAPRADTSVSTGTTCRSVPAPDDKPLLYIDIDKDEIEIAIAREGFPSFWEAYPKKVGKGAAQKKFDALTKGKPDLAGVIVRAARAYSARVKVPGADLKFVPHAATWLNQGRWEDDLDHSTLPVVGRGQTSAADALIGLAQESAREHWAQQAPTGREAIQ